LSEQLPLASNDTRLRALSNSSAAPVLVESGLVWGLAAADNIVAAVNKPIRQGVLGPAPFMESPLSLLRTHWDLEPEICKSFEIKPSVFRFMESSGALSISVDTVAMGMKLTANATPMPAPFAIVDQTHQVQRDAAEPIFSEHQCHRTPLRVIDQALQFRGSWCLLVAFIID
jgi:hypothetical protein